MLKKVLANRRSQSLIVSTASDPAMLDSDCKADMIYNKAYFKVHGKRQL